MNNQGSHTRNVINFYHPLAFWLGTTAVIFGVVSHIPMFLTAADMDYRMVGMQMSGFMMTGMFAIIAGIVFVVYGLLPHHVFKLSRHMHNHLADVHISALDNAVLTSTHWKLFIVLIIALIVDVMKAASLGFVIPGTAEEYGLSKSSVTILPMAGILGTTIGSFLWGWLGDTIGRRASILIAAIIFIGTAVCGAMPSYSWNVLMCFIMGLGSGGMLPITFTLLAEIVPVKHRGWMIVVLGSIGTIGGYLAASGSAALLEPIFGWRIMWFLGLPTGVILILLNRYIPESPRYLLARGDKEEAYQVMENFGVEITQDDKNITEHADTEDPDGNIHAGSLRALFHNPFISLSMGLGLYGFAWGMVNFGFLLWLPLNLREMGMSLHASDAILAKSAIIAFPATLFGAWLYHSWSAKKTLVLFAMLTVGTLIGFAVIGTELANNSLIMSMLLVALLASSSCVIAMLSPYTAGIFPVHIRSTASGWSAGCSKGAGVATLGAATIGLTPGIATAALVAAVPTLIAAIAIAWKGIETRGISLEVIQDNVYRKN